MKRTVILSLLPLTMGAIGAAQTSEDRGHEIALEANRRATGFGDLSATLHMIVRNGRGTERVRELAIKTLEVDDEGQRTLVRFEEPRDLRGTALLTVGHGDGSSDQWLYLPSLQRVKRIAGASRSGSFMGSEFSYEDVSAMQPDRYTYRLIATDTLEGMPALIVELRPIDPSSQYSRQLVWFDESEYRVLRIDFYDRGDILLKTLTLNGFRKYGNRFWRPDVMEMVNQQTGASTALQWSNLVLGTGLDPRDFDPKRLGRGE